MTDNKDIYSRAVAIREAGSQQHQRIGSFLVTGNSYYIQFLSVNSKSEGLTGWKFHLSVAAEDAARATEMIADIYEQFGGEIFKVTNPETTKEFADPNAPGEHRGKTFTLYDMGEKNWSQILQEIENRFRQAGIKKGPRVESDRHVMGSRYISYRNDGNRRGGMNVAASDLAAYPLQRRYNPYGEPDPHTGIVIKSLVFPRGREQNPNVEQDLRALERQLNRVMHAAYLGLPIIDAKEVQWSFHPGSTAIPEPHLRLGPIIRLRGYEQALFNFLKARTGLPLRCENVRDGVPLVTIKPSASIANDGHPRLSLSDDEVYVLGHAIMRNGDSEVMSSRPDIRESIALLNKVFGKEDGDGWRFQPSSELDGSNPFLFLNTGVKNYQAAAPYMDRLTDAEIAFETSTDPVSGDIFIRTRPGFAETTSIRRNDALKDMIAAAAAAERPAQGRGVLGFFKPKQ